MKINNLVKPVKDSQIIDGREVVQKMEKERVERAFRMQKEWGMGALLMGYDKEAEIFVEIYEEDIEKDMDIMDIMGLKKSGRKIIGSLYTPTERKRNKLVSIVAKVIANLKKNNKQLTMKEIFTNKTIVKGIIASVRSDLVEKKRNITPFLFSEAEKKMMDTIRKIGANKKVSPYIRRSNDDIIK